MSSHSYTLDTNRLRLRNIQLSDAEFIYNLLNSESWKRYIGERYIHELEDAENYIERILESNDIYYWVMLSKEQHVPIGIITFIKKVYLDHFDLGFALLPEFTDSGYAFEAAHAVLNFIKHELGHSTILATTLPENNQSIRLLKKLDFVFQRTIIHQEMTLQVYIHHMV